MRSRKRAYLVWVVLVAFSGALFSACATPALPKPKVVVPAAAYPNAVTVAGVTVAAVPFNPHRDVYAAPYDPHPPKPDFNWFKAGVCPVRLIINNDGDVPCVVHPRQITCTDARGITYKPYNAREAGDAVLASEAFAGHVERALRGTLVGAALGAGLGAAVGSIAGGSGAAARGAAIGATLGGVQGLMVGTARSRPRMEARVRRVLSDKMLRTQTLSRGMSCDGLVYFPAVPITSIRVALAEAGGPSVLNIYIPVVMPPQVN
jgi:hypothetical protein